MSHECCAKVRTNRYVSYDGIDCPGNVRRVMEHIDRHVAIPERNTLFWQYFNKKRVGLIGPKSDDLFLIHSNLNQIRELFETYEDVAALALLDQVEEECC